MKILIISPVLTPPANRGNRARIQQIAQHLLDQQHEVHFFAFPYTPFDETDYVRAYHFWKTRFHTPDKKHRHRFGSQSIFNKILYKFRTLFRLGTPPGKTIWIDDYVDFSITAQLRKLHREHRFEAVIVNYVFFSRYLRIFGRKVLKILDTHDVYTNRHVMYEQHGLTNHMVSLSKRSERRGLRRADVVLAIQPNEQKYLQSLTRKEVVVVGHLLAPVTFRKKENPSPAILFVGAANQINEDGLRWFLAEGLPRVRQRYPTAELWVAGGICSLLDEAPDVVLLGVLNDLSDVYQAAWVVINPCRFGTGLKIKTIEALAAGRPLVTTTAGGDGLEAQAGTAYLRSDNMESIAGAIIDLFGNPNKREELRTHALAFMKQYHRQQLTTLDAVLAQTPSKT